MKILITNVVMLNGGDAAIVFGMQRAIREAFGPEVEIRIHVRHPAIVASLYPELFILETVGLYAGRFPQRRYIGRIVREIRKAQLWFASLLLRRGWSIPTLVVPDRSIRRALKEYATADLIVSAGGTYLRDDYGMLSNLADYRVVLRLGKPLAFFTQSIGPFDNLSSVHPLRQIFDQSICMLLRDERSAEQARAMGVSGPEISVVPDAAFALGDAVALATIAESPAPVCPQRVAISVREWQHFATCSNDVGMRRYVSAMADLARHLVMRGVAEIVFLSTCQGITTYDDDAILADAIVREAALIENDRVVVVREFIRFDCLQEVLRTFDFAVCTRLHVAILCLIGGVSVVPIAYEFKSTELFSQLGLAEYVLDIETVSSQSLIRAVDKLIQDLTGVRRRCVPRIVDMCNRAVRSGVPLREAFEKRIGRKVKDHSRKS